MTQVSFEMTCLFFHASSRAVYLKWTSIKKGDRFKLKYFCFSAFAASPRRVRPVLQPSTDGHAGWSVWFHSSSKATVHRKQSIILRNVYPRAGTLNPFCPPTKLKNFGHLEKSGFIRGHVGALRRCTHTLAENPNVTPRNRKSHFCTCIHVHKEPRARPTRTVLCSLQCRRRPSCEIHVSRPV